MKKSTEAVILRGVGFLRDVDTAVNGRITALVLGLVDLLQALLGDFGGLLVRGHGSSSRNEGDESSNGELHFER